MSRLGSTSRTVARCGSFTVGSPRPRQRHPGSPAATQLDLGLAPVSDAGRVAGRSGHHRHVAACPRQRAAGRRPVGTVARSLCGSSVFTCPASTCGKTPMCTRRWSPSCWRGPACTPTTLRCPKTNASSCWPASWAPGARWSADRRRGCPSWRARNSASSPPPRGPLSATGPPAVPNYIISMCQSVSDMLEAAILLKEAGLLDVRADEPYCPVGIVPLFETIDDLQRGASILEAALDLPVYRALVAPRRQPRGDAGLLRLQQGRRLSGRQLGALPGRARPCRIGSQNRNSVAALPRSRRHRRPRRRTQLSGDPGAAAGRGERLAAPHRAG